MSKRSSWKWHKHFTTPDYEALVKRAKYNHKLYLKRTKREHAKDPHWKQLLRINAARVVGATNANGIMREIGSGLYGPSCYRQLYFGMKDEASGVLPMKGRKS